MNVLLSELPIWVKELIAWITTGTNIAGLAGIIAALIKLGTARKETKFVTDVQVNLLQIMVTKLSDIKSLSDNVQSVSGQVAESLAYFEKAIESQRQANANFANFMMECFNKSNLTDEAKADLKLMADKIFYNDNTALVDALKTANAQANAAVIEGNKKIAQLQSELEAEKAKLIQAQENVKSNRRL